MEGEVWKGFADAGAHHDSICRIRRRCWNCGRLYWPILLTLHQFKTRYLCEMEWSLSLLSLWLIGYMCSSLKAIDHSFNLLIDFISHSMRSNAKNLKTLALVDTLWAVWEFSQVSATFTPLQVERSLFLRVFSNLKLLEMVTFQHKKLFKDFATLCRNHCLSLDILLAS